ncbi:MAG: cytosolic protein [Bacillus sp. (in: Bacteria)]|nr:cytosolic protein [Bacillus sp. (in: firmicutes)]
MKSFVVGFHQEDNVDSMQIQKLSQEEFTKSSEGGTRKLFELDTNIGLFVFFDGANSDGDVSYMVLQYEDENDDPVACYSFQLKDFYEFMALFLNDLEINDETEEEDEDEYGPIHHLAHLLFHIIEEGKDLEV